MNQFWKLVARDLLLAVREGGAVGTALGFFLVVVALMPLGLGPDLNLLSRIASGVLWIALLLAALLSLGRIFETDYDDGTLEVLATGALPLQAVTAAKALAHWLSTGIPLALLAPLLGILLNLDLKATPALVVVPGLDADRRWVQADEQQPVTEWREILEGFDRGTIDGQRRPMRTRLGPVGEGREVVGHGVFGLGASLPSNQARCLKSA